MFKNLIANLQNYRIQNLSIIKGGNGDDPTEGNGSTKPGGGSPPPIKPSGGPISRPTGGS